jgi:hypothetical protein
MCGAIRTSGDRKLLIKRLVPFEQRPPARPIVQPRDVHRSAAPLQLSPFVLYSGALQIPFIEFGYFMNGSVSALAGKVGTTVRGSCCRSCTLRQKGRGMWTRRPLRLSCEASETIRPPLAR